MHYQSFTVCSPHIIVHTAISTPHNNCHCTSNNCTPSEGKGNWLLASFCLPWTNWLLSSQQSKLSPFNINSQIMSQCVWHENTFERRLQDRCWLGGQQQPLQVFVESSLKWKTEQLLWDNLAQIIQQWMKNCMLGIPFQQETVTGAGGGLGHECRSWHHTWPCWTHTDKGACTVKEAAEMKHWPTWHFAQNVIMNSGAWHLCHKIWRCHC